MDEASTVTLMKLSKDKLLSALGVALLLVWCVWWGVSLQQGHLLHAEETSIHIPAFGVDFYRNTELPTRIWLRGDNPYADKDLLFAYPPIVTRLFSWVYLFTPPQALVVWVVSLALMAASAALLAASWRRSLNLPPIPASLAVALILFSAPVLFALERSNYDLLIVPFLLGGLALSEKASSTCKTIGGMLIAIAIWMKLYPALLLIGLFAARRFRTLAWTVFWLAIIGLSDLAELAQFAASTKIHISRAMADAAPGNFMPCAWNHSLSLSWPALFAHTPLRFFRGNQGAVVIIGGLIVWVSLQVWRARDIAKALLAPYLLWIVAAATFVPPVSNDYNLAPLVLAFLALWNGRRPFNYVLLLVLAIWWQPVGLPISGKAMFFIKLFGLMGTAALVVQQSRLPRSGKP